MRVLIADKFEQAGAEALRALGCQIADHPKLAAEDLAGTITELDPEVLIVRSTKVFPEAINAGSSLRLIIRAGSGTDNIDCNAAASRDIGVCNCPGMNAVAVAELAIGLLVACDRRIPDQTSDLHAGKWDKKGYAKSRGLKGRTLGVVGVGSIGVEVVHRARAFGMHIHAWSRSMNAEKAGQIGASWWGSSREDLLTLAASADAISIHVALTDETKGLCDGPFFDRVKPGAILINTARGPVVDDDALAGAIRDKGVRVGLDVWNNQPAPGDSAFASDLLALPGVYGTHHCGASTDQAQSAVAQEAVRIVQVFKDTGRFENRVNGPALTPTVRAGSAQAAK